MRLPISTKRSHSNLCWQKRYCVLHISSIHSQGHTNPPQETQLQAEGVTDAINTDHDSLLNFNPGLNVQLHEHHDLAFDAETQQPQIELQGLAGDDKRDEEVFPGPRVVHMRCRWLVRFGLHGQFCTREGY